MRALVKYQTGPGNVEVRDVDSPTPESGQVLIEIAHAAMCGTDRLAIEGSHEFGTARTLGHEASGTIIELGEDLSRSDLQIGDRVTIETDAYLCMECEYCRREQFNRCPHRLGIGTTTDGALAERLAMPERAIHLLPENVSLLQGALTEPLAIAVHAVTEQSPSLAGEVVVIIGPGTIGQLCAQVAHAVGATVVLAGRSRHKAALRDAQEFGIPYTVDTESQDLGAFVSGLTEGYGAHSVFECSGAIDSASSSLRLLRRGGRIVLVAFYREEPRFHIDAVINRELEIVGSRGKRPSSYRTALRMMQNETVDVARLMSTRLPLEQWEEGLREVAVGRKVVFDIAT